MSKKTIYLSGAISNDRSHAKKFKAAQEKLEAKGYKVINPVEHVEKERGKKWLDYLIDCLCLIINEKPDIIYLMKGWDRSAGAQIERLVFLKLEKKIMTEREDG